MAKQNPVHLPPDSEIRAATLSAMRQTLEPVTAKQLAGLLKTALTLKAPTATDRDECLFVWVRLQASPRMIWREWKDIRKIFDVSPFTLSPSTKPDKSGTVPVIEAPLILSVSSVMR